MKRLFLILLAVLLAGCSFFYNHIEISGSTPGIKDGDVFIKNSATDVVFGTAVRAGKFYIPKQELKTSGYYSLYLPDISEPFEIYLEPGKYSIKTNPAKPGAYPVISTSSKNQNELSAYYGLADGIFLKYREEKRRLIDQMNSPDAKLMAPQQYEDLVDQVKIAQTKNDEASVTAVNEYLKRFPDNEVVAHLVSNMDYESHPLEFYKLYQKFGDRAKNSSEGVYIGKLLGALIKLRPGVLAPALGGKTPDNQTIDFKALNKKVIIVDFWRASLMPSRRNHQKFLTEFLPNYEEKGVGIVSVSLDTKPDWWLTAIKDDKMTWPQIADLKGTDSPNVKNWGVKIIPMYYVLDGSGHILQRDVHYEEIPVTVNNYLDKQL